MSCCLYWHALWYLSKRDGRHVAPVNIQAEDIGATVMTGHIQGFSGIAGILEVDLGTEDTFLLMQRTGNDATERLDDHRIAGIDPLLCIEQCITLRKGVRNAMPCSAVAVLSTRQPPSRAIGFIDASQVSPLSQVGAEFDILRIECKAGTGASGKRSTTADYFAAIISNGLTPPQDQRL